jgi:hypothetical protein
MAGPMIRENPLTTLRNPSACNWSGPTISEQGIMASGTWNTPHQQVEDMAASQHRSCIRKN